MSTPLAVSNPWLSALRVVAATEAAPKFLAIAAAARFTDVVPPRISSVSPWRAIQSTGVRSAECTAQGCGT